MRSDVCGACKFWQQTSDQTGECRREPPKLFILQAPPSQLMAPRPPEPTMMAAFPPTSATAWCGAFAEDIDDGDEEVTPPDRPRAA